LTIRDATATHCNECYEYDCNGGLVGIDYFGISDVALSDNGAVITIGAINTIGATLATARVKYSGYDVEYSVNMTLPFAGQGVLRIEAVGSNGMNAIWSLVVGESDTTTEGQILSVVSNAACGARQFNIIDFIAAPGTYYDAAYKVYQDGELMLEDEPISSQQYNGVTTIGSHNIRSVVSWNIDGNTELISENYIEYTINCQ
jgi:hypothetical protein